MKKVVLKNKKKELAKHLERGEFGVWNKDSGENISQSRGEKGGEKNHKEAWDNS